jgi:serine protease AprX
MRRSLGLSLALCLALALSMPAPASAASSRDPRRTAPPVPALRDVNANGVGDVLESRMRGRPLEDRYDVVVTTDGSVGVAASKRAVGDFRVLRRLPIVDGFSATVSGGQAVALARMPGVERVEANVVVHATMDAARADFGVDRARADFGLTGAGVGACVLDTGVDPNHEQLDSKTILFQDFVASATDPYDDHGHGTHVASILLGDGTGGPNAERFGGVAPAASLVAGKVLDANGSGTTDDIVAAIEWCAGLPSVDVISMSLGSMFGSDGTDALSEAVNAAVAGGTIAVVAAGNSSDAPYSIGSPGAATGAITIGAAADWSAAPGAPNHSDGVSLAFFSSRGPTLDDRTKPDVVAPGVTITAAEQGTATGYLTYSGTSMATPFAAGAIALALQSQPGWTPTEVRSAIENTAQDRGAPGIDNDWGAGLLDVYALTALAEGLPNAETAFPAHTHVSAVVQNDGVWTYQFVLGGGDLDVPIAATILVDGTCTFFFPGFGCLDSNWSPDLDSRLTDPDGIVLDESMCALGNECGIGRQETLHAMPTVAGTYTIEVYPFADSPNDGMGGSFEFDLSRGPVGSEPPPPPPPPPPPGTMHVGDLDGASVQVTAKRWEARVTIRVHDAAEMPLAGVLVRARWNSSSTTVSCTTNANGACRIDKRWANSRARVTLTVVSLVSSGLVYLSTDDHDPDGESDGTVIGVTRP